MSAPALDAAIVNHVLERLAAHDTPGATVAIVRRGLVEAISVGHADLERRTPLVPDARFPVYSVTKTMISALVLRQVETGAIGLDDPIEGYLPEVSLGPAVTVRRVLNHSAGISDYGALEAYHTAVREQPETPWSATEFLANTLPAWLDYVPGEGWGYSNIGYMLLKQLVERIAGISFATQVAEVFAIQPGLDSLGTLERLADMASLTQGFSTALGDAATVADVRGRYHPGWVSHGLVAADVATLARLLDAILGGGLLSDASLSAMLHPVRVPHEHPFITEPSYGLGLMLDPGSRHGLVAGHTGGGPGYAAAVYRFPALDTVVAVLANRDGSDIATELAFAIADGLATQR